ncbi:MAG: sirohydrochlorin cobaltochelatase, partial [Bacteroides cellulosilyticus]
YPTLDATLAQLKETRPKQVTLIPLLLVCGNHTKEDIVGVWKPEMERQVIRPMSACRDWVNNPLSGSYIWNTLRRC